VRRRRFGALAALALGLGTLGADVAAPVAIFPSGAEFRLEIAADRESQRRGYMFRERIPPDEGMLFVYGQSGRRSFWMKNCRVALDIIWLDEGSHVIEIGHSLPPCTADPCPSYEPQRMARNVLEVAAGTAVRERLAVGDVVQIVPEPSVP
jgi:uncharacterized membrane protein (UPF0127 family)